MNPFLRRVKYIEIIINDRRTRERSLLQLLLPMCQQLRYLSQPLLYQRSLRPTLLLGYLIDPCHLQWQRLELSLCFLSIVPQLCHLLWIQIRFPQVLLLHMFLDVVWQLQSYTRIVWYIGCVITSSCHIFPYYPFSSSRAGLYSCPHLSGTCSYEWFHWHEGTCRDSSRWAY